MAWHGSDCCITGPLCWESSGYLGMTPPPHPHPTPRKGWYCRPVMIPKCCRTEQDFQQTVEFPVIWATLMLMWHHHNNHKKPQPSFIHHRERHSWLTSWSQNKLSSGQNTSHKTCTLFYCAFVLLFYQLLLGSCDQFSHILQSYLTVAVASAWFPQYQWSNRAIYA